MNKKVCLCLSVCLSVCVDSLLRGCRLRRRICNPDNVIVGVVDTLTSRDLNSERSRRTRSDSSTRRDERNSLSLERVDSGLADESATVSPLSSAFTENIHDELTLPPAPAIVVDSLSTAQHLAMNTQSTSFDSNLSYAANAETSKVAAREDKENRVSGSRKKKKKKKKLKKKEQKERTTTKDGDDRRRGEGKQSAGSQLVDESLWDLNGVKLWRFCAQILSCSSKLGANDAEADGATAAATARHVKREPGTTLLCSFDFKRLFVQYTPPTPTRLSCRVEL